MITRLVAVGAAVLLPTFASVASAQDAPKPTTVGAATAPATPLPLKLDPKPTKGAISVEDLMTRLYVFADDSMMGRDAGTLGSVKATDYLAAEAKRIGLVPAGDNGTYFQTLPLKTRRVDPLSTFIAGGATLTFGTEFAISGNSTINKPDLETVYGGVIGDTARRISPEQAAGKLVVMSMPASQEAIGAVLGNEKLIRPVIRSLATLVHQRRGRLAEDEADFIAALKLLQREGLQPEQLVGSWAGAIGHLQVNPSNVIAHGADGDGDGHVDLHRSLADALATSAKFLIDLGYRPGLDWGFEVDVPTGFDYLLATRDSLRPVSFFAERGITRVRGRAFADPATPVFLYAPAGRNGPKFLMTSNYLVLKGYNFSDSYALSVAHMTDRLKGAGTFANGWPRDTKFPNLEQRKGIQQALIRLGLYDGVVDGRIGPISQAAYAQFQAAQGLVADGFITYRSYEELLAAAPQ